MKNQLSSTLNSSRFIFIWIFLIYSVFLSASHTAYASTSDGTIPANSYAWGENMGWLNFGCASCNVHVTNTLVTGDIWSSQYGWINLSSTNGGVTNDGNGTLGGTAWSSGLGWIPFTGVTIDSNGVFGGTAGTHGSVAGRINFSCTNCTVTTDWRPVSVQTSQNQSSSGSQLKGYSTTGSYSTASYYSVSTTTVPIATSTSYTSPQNYPSISPDTVQRSTSIVISTATPTLVPTKVSKPSKILYTVSPKKSKTVVYLTAADGNFSSLPPVILALSFLILMFALFSMLK